MNVLNKIKSKQNKTTQQNGNQNQLLQNNIVCKQNKSQPILQKNQASIQNQKKQDKKVTGINKSTKKLLSKVINQPNKNQNKQIQSQNSEYQNQKNNNKKSIKQFQKYQKLQNKKQNSSQDILKITETYDSRNSDFSDDAPQFLNSISKIIKLQNKFKWTHPSLQKYQVSQISQSKQHRNSYKYQQKQKRLSKQKQDHKLQQYEQKNKKDEITTKTHTHNQFKIQPQHIPKQYKYLLKIKKGYQIGRMCIFQGYVQQSKSNNQLKIKIRTMGSQIIKLSCKIQLINNPQSISYIFMNRMVQVGKNQYLVHGGDMIKAIQKAGNKK